MARLATQIRALLPSSPRAAPGFKKNEETAASAARILPDEFSVVTFVDHGPIMVVTHLAIMAAGGILVPADATYPADRLKLMMEETECVVALVHAHDRQQLLKKLGESGAGGSASAGTDANEHVNEYAAMANKLVAVESIGGYSVSDDGITIVPPAIPTTLEELDAAAAAVAAAAAGESSSDEADEAAVNFASPFKLCHIVFTSGSTGVAKGVMTEHRALLAHGTAKNEGK